jgi:hypothetical protein
VEGIWQVDTSVIVASHLYRVVLVTETVMRSTKLVVLPMPQIIRRQKRKEMLWQSAKLIILRV